MPISPVLARESVRLWWLWTLSSAQASWFVVHLSRGMGAASDLLGAFGGTLVTDDYGGYNRVPSTSVLKRLRAGRLIGIEGERRGVRFPRAQFSPEEGVWPGPASARSVHSFPTASPRGAG